MEGPIISILNTSLLSVFLPNLAAVILITIVKYVKSYGTKINWTNASTTDYRAVYYDPTFKEISAIEM
jgi:hypothetical protein